MHSDDWYFLNVQIRTPPTLEQLLKESRIPSQLLDQKCSDNLLQSISFFLEWRIVAPYLGLSVSEIEEIESTKRTEFERRLAMLLSWREKFGYMAKFRVLVKSFLNAGQTEHAERACRLLLDQGTFLTCMKPCKIKVYLFGIL